MSTFIGTNPDQVPVNGMLGDLAFQDIDSVKITDLTYTGTLTGSTGILNIGSGQVYKDASGNVGIGTSSPSSFGKFAVVGSNTGGAIVNYFSNSWTTATANTQVVLSLDPGGNGYGVRDCQIRAINNGVNQNSLAFYTSNGAAPVEALRIDASGNVGIGNITTGASLSINKNITGGVTSYGAVSAAVIQSDVTSNANIFLSLPSTIASTFTLGSLRHFYASQNTIGAGSAVTNQYGYHAELTLTGATNNYGFFGNIASGTGRYNLYMSGTADNYLAGNLGIGTSNPTEKLTVQSGNMYVNGGFLKSNRPNASADTIGGLVLQIDGVTQAQITTPSSNSMAMYSGGTERMRIDSSGNVGIGTTSPNASAILDAQSTTKGVRMPNMTTTQKNAIASPAAGLMVFDTTLAKLCVYSGTAWQTITSI